MPIVLNAIKEHQWSSKGNPLNIGVEYLTQTENYSEYRTMVKMPFPLKNRDMCISQWEFSPSPNRAVLVIDNLSGTVPPQKGFVRTKAYGMWVGGVSGMWFCCIVCGWEIELEEGEKVACKVSYLSHADPKVTEKFENFL